MRENQRTLIITRRYSEQLAYKCGVRVLVLSSLLAIQSLLLREYEHTEVLPVVCTVSGFFCSSVVQLYAAFVQENWTATKKTTGNQYCTTYDNWHTGVQVLDYATV
jgi:hypothetical protein